MIIQANFSISGFAVHPTEISRILGADPDDTGVAGEIRQRVYGKGIHVVQDSYWDIGPANLSSSNAEDHISALLARITPFERMSNLPPESYKKLTIALHVYDDEKRPSMFLDKVILRQIAKFDIELDVCLYSSVTSPDEPPGN